MDLTSPLSKLKATLPKCPCGWLAFLLLIGVLVVCCVPSTTGPFVCPELTSAPSSVLTLDFIAQGEKWEGESRPVHSAGLSGSFDEGDLIIRRCSPQHQHPHFPWGAWSPKASTEQNVSYTWPSWVKSRVTAEPGRH